MPARAGIDENIVELAMLEWFGSLDYTVLHGGDIGPGEPAAERDDYREVLLVGRLRAALERLNPGAFAGALGEAFRILIRTDSPDLLQQNRRFHRLLVDGVSVEVADPRAAFAASSAGGGLR